MRHFGVPMKVHEIQCNQCKFRADITGYRDSVRLFISPSQELTGYVLIIF